MRGPAMPNLLDEDLMPFAAGVRSLPGRPHLSTGYRYALRGFHGVILETMMCGGRRYTSRQALRRFVDAVTAAANRRPQSPIPTRPSELVDDRVERDLDSAGI